MLSLKRYGWLCVLGGEIAYLVCLAGGYLPLRSSRGMELHRTLFETFPGFVWGSVGSVILGAVYVFVLAWIFAWYFVWMHNTSLVSKETREGVSAPPLSKGSTATETGMTGSWLGEFESCERLK